MVTISDLPHDMLIEIGLKLDMRDLLNLCQTSQRMKNTYQDDNFWKIRYCEEFDGRSWKEKYVHSTIKCNKAYNKEHRCRWCGKQFKLGTSKFLCEDCSKVNIR